MLRIHIAVIALLTLGGIEAVHAQNGRDGRNSDPSPVHMLLRMETQLGLTARQVEQLHRIDADMERENEPLVTKLREIRRKIRSLGSIDSLTAERRTQFEAYVAESRPVMREIKQNHWTAMRRVGEVLNEAQKEAMGKLLREMDQANRERSGDSPRPASRGN